MRRMVAMVTLLYIRYDSAAISMVPTLTVLKLDFKNLEFFRWSIGVVTDVLECRLSVAPWRKTKQGHACKKPGKQNGKRSNSNNKIHTNKLKKRSCKNYNASWRHLVANHY